MWFKENEKRLRKFEQDPDKYLNEISKEAKKIQSGLVIELEPPKNNLITMTISADGVRELFIIVKTIIDKAPKMDGWNFIAFRQRIDSDKVKGMTVKLGNYKLNPQSIKFFPMPDVDTLDVIIYIKGVTEENYNDIAYGGLLLIDNILGEYDCVTKIRTYDFHNMPTKKQELDNLFPLLDLAAYVDRFHSSEKR